MPSAVGSQTFSVMWGCAALQDKINWNEVAVLVHRSRVGEVGDMIEARDVQKMQAAIKKAKHMFTYDYTCAYISSFVAKVASATAIIIIIIIFIVVIVILTILIILILTLIIIIIIIPTHASCHAPKCSSPSDTPSLHIDERPAGADSSIDIISSKLSYMQSIIPVWHENLGGFCEICNDIQRCIDDEVKFTNVADSAMLNKFILLPVFLLQLKNSENWKA